MAIPSQKDIFDFLQGNLDSMLSTLAFLTNKDTPSTDKPLLDSFAFELKDLWHSFGAKAEVLVQTEYGNHVRAEFGEGERQILIVGHFDTVWNAGETKKRPFRVEDGIAYGPGACDMKGGIVESLFALKALKHFGCLPSKKVVVINNSEEEIGSPSSRPIIEQEALKSDAVLVLEPAAHGGALKTWRKGVGMFDVRIKGRNAHAGSDFEKGVSAAVEAARQILYLSELTCLEKGTTVNVGIVKSGTRRNVVPDEAVLGVDVRVKTLEEAKLLTEKILSIKPFDPRTTVTVSGGINRPPMERNERNLSLFRVAKACGEEMGLEITEAGTGGGSDGNFTSALGIPTLDGLGPVGGEAHAPGEFLFVNSLPERAALVAGLLLRL